jgi:multidrug efflux pump subunit AcrA (membrane-fusion protein)
VYLSFDSDDTRINAGMYAGVKLYTTLYKDVVTVPEDAVVSIYEKDYVYVVNADSTVSRREVKKGASVDGVCAIVSGLEPGERIAVDGVTVLSDGVTVKDISQKEKSGASESAADGAKQ